MQYSGAIEDVVFSTELDWRMRETGQNFKKQIAPQLNGELSSIKSLLNLKRSDVIFNEISRIISLGESWLGVLPLALGHARMWVQAFIRPVSRQGRVVAAQWLLHAASEPDVARAKRFYRHMKKPLAKRLLGLLGSRRALIDDDIYRSFSQLYILGGSSSSVKNHAIYMYRLRDESLNLMALRVGVGTRDIRTAVKHSLDNAKQANEKSLEAKDSVVSFASAMEEMTTTVNDIAKNANESSGTADDAFKDINNAGDLVKQTTDDIEQLTEQVSEVADMTSSLVERSKAVATVTDQIDAIAEQTNLLALNAAIEAARAGESGRGFAVVADEVRELSQRTQNSVEQIESTIQNMVNEIQTWQQRMETQREKALSCRQTSHQAQQTLITSITGIQGISDSMTQIAVAAEQHTQAVKEMNSSIYSISGLIDETRTLASATSDEVSDVTGRLTEFRSLVAAFEED